MERGSEPAVAFLLLLLSTTLTNDKFDVHILKPQHFIKCLRPELMRAITCILKHPVVVDYTAETTGLSKTETGHLSWSDELFTTLGCLQLDADYAISCQVTSDR
ncbi:hypothetical protein T265_11862 [Opisthorchis viverrini]|uniref:Uncharacterized protein n=1 Tax=Opisthorchis viverrini TaxID=6198 RepID=A0A074ZVW9_OPIVI|nr:hypothetical protein T265_11862 [Opisthorchis viverrini]KER19329.1 hypothetical protein T265_11862 [Opisthorchis viverrini]